MSLADPAYRLLFEESPDGLVVVDPVSGEIRESNGAFDDLVGCGTDDVLGRPLASFVVRDSDRELAAHLRERPDDSSEWEITSESGGSTLVDARLTAVSVRGEDLVLACLRPTDDEEARRDTNRKARAVAEAPIGITISDPTRDDNPLIYANEEFRRLTGYAADDVLGRNCRFLQGDATGSEPVAAMRDAIDAEEPVTVELRNYRADGTTFWNRVTIAPVRAADGTVTEFVGFQENITDRKRSERQLRRSHRLLEAVPSGVLRTAPSCGGTIEYANPGLASLLGADSVDELVGQAFEEFYVDPDARAALVEALDDSDGRQVKREAEIETLDGDRRDVVVTAVLSEDETGTAHINKIVQDITERKRYERRLEEQRDNLEVLNEIVRHDIRNDLQLVTAYADHLSDHVDDGGDHLEMIRESAGHAVELTQSARDLAEVMLSTERNTRCVDLRTSLENELDSVRSEFTDAVVTVDSTVPRVSVTADRMLNSVFRNLLTNAVQHNDKRVPEVELSTEVRDDTVVVRIADNGPGIPDDQKADVFGKGEKGLESEGTGIGLYLVETLVEMYGGAVFVEDNHPEGAVFVVELPRVT